MLAYLRIQYIIYAKMIIIFAILQKPMKFNHNLLFDRKGLGMKTEDLKKMKDECGFTTREISKLSGVPESTISRIFSGQTDNPSFDAVCAVVQAMGGSLDTLTGMKTDTQVKDDNSLIEIYKKIVAEKNRYIKIELGICCVLIGVLVFIVIMLFMDIINGNIGYIRY